MPLVIENNRKEYGQELPKISPDMLKTVSIVGLGLAVAALFFEPFRKGALAAVGAIQVYSLINKMEKGKQVI